MYTGVHTILLLPSELQYRVTLGLPSHVLLESKKDIDTRDIFSVSFIPTTNKIMKFLILLCVFYCPLYR